MARQLSSGHPRGSGTLTLTARTSNFSSRDTGPNRRRFRLPLPSRFRVCLAGAGPTAAGIFNKDRSPALAATLLRIYRPRVGTSGEAETPAKRPERMTAHAPPGVVRPTRKYESAGWSPAVNLGGVLFVPVLSRSSARDDSLAQHPQMLWRRGAHTCRDLWGCWQPRTSGLGGCYAMFRAVHGRQ
jgi:hypothetical protein